MPDPTPSTPPPQTPPLPTHPSDVGKPAATGAAPLRQPDDALKQPGTRDEKDPTRDLLDRMDRMRPLIAALEPAFARTMQNLSERGVDTDRRAQMGFRHEVAYALQDLEKTPLGRIDVPPALRQEMTRLAGSAPGLQNERMQAVMRTTEGIANKSLVTEIRNTGADIGRQVEQDKPNILSLIEALENKVRLAQRPPEAATPPETARTGQNPAGGARAAGPGSNDDGSASSRSGAPQGPAMGQPLGQAPQQIVLGRGVLDTLMAGMRSRDQGTGAPWDPPPTPMADRLSAFERKMIQASDERRIETAIKSGRAAVDALQGFSSGEGASVMRRIQQVAHSEPGGMSTVLSEMREGGKFADLRRQFNNALETNLGLAGAYDKASAALRTFDRDRSTAQDIIARRPDAVALTQRFERLDADVADAAARTPSRNDGSSMFDDLSQKAAELLQKAVTAVKSVFSRSPSADGPSPSP